MNAAHDIDLRPVKSGELPAFVDVFNQIWPEMAVTTVQLEHEDAEFGPAFCERRWIAWDHQTPVGFGSLQQTFGTSDGNWFLGIGVLVSHQGRGIGARLDAHGMATLEPGTTKLNTQVREVEPSSVRFAISRGYLEAKRDFFSKLDITSAEPDLTPCSGIEIRSLAEADSPVTRRQLHAVYEEVRLDVPRTTIPEPMSEDVFENLLLGDPELLRHAMMLAIHDGEVVGFTGAFQGAREGVANQMLTGVRRSFRGRGVASALKNQMLARLKADGYRQIQTDNDSRNVAMLAINNRMGFVRDPAILWMVRDQLPPDS